MGKMTTLKTLQIYYGFGYSETPPFPVSFRCFFWSYIQRASWNPSDTRSSVRSFSHWSTTGDTASRVSLGITATARLQSNERFHFENLRFRQRLVNSNLIGFDLELFGADPIASAPTCVILWLLLQSNIIKPRNGKMQTKISNATNPIRNRLKTFQNIIKIKTK